MKFDRYHPQSLDHLLKASVDEITSVVFNNTPLTKLEFAGVRPLIRSILQRRLKEAWEWGYSKRDGEPEPQPDQKQVEVADKIVGDSEKGYRDSRIGPYIKW